MWRQALRHQTDVGCLQVVHLLSADHLHLLHAVEQLGVEVEDSLEVCSPAGNLVGGFSLLDGGFSHLGSSFGLLGGGFSLLPLLNFGLQTGDQAWRRFQPSSSVAFRPANLGSGQARVVLEFERIT
jgi:hypothetical protein